MKLAKKLVALLLTLALGCAVLGGCTAAPAEDSGKLNVIATIFPVYDWTKHLTEEVEDVDLTLLLDKGVDIHSFQPTADDMIRISTCDVFIYVGGESDKWVDDALKNAVNKDMVVVNLMDVLGDKAKEEEVVEGMQADEDEEEESDEPEYDEHVWLSLYNAEFLCEAISDALQQADEAHADAYRANTEAYVQKLDELFHTYAENLDGAKFDTLLFGDRFPFRYLVDDYDLNYYAAFVGCSAETEASFETVTFLADKLNELQLPAVLVIDGSDKKIAESIIRTANSSAEILTLNSMQSETTQTAQADGGYLEIMQSNLDVIQKALN